MHFSATLYVTIREGERTGKFLTLGQEREGRIILAAAQEAWDWLDKNQLTESGDVEAERKELEAVASSFLRLLRTPSTATSPST